MLYEFWLDNINLISFSMQFKSSNIAQLSSLSLFSVTPYIDVQGLEWRDLACKGSEMA